MFTGIVEAIGEIVSKEFFSYGYKLVISSPLDISSLNIGDSIAVNGACLTVTKLLENRFIVDLSPETLKRTTLGELPLKSKVNLERALQWGARVGGHFISGHIDEVGKILRRWQKGNFIFFQISISSLNSRYLVPKGSIAIDGVSLTINNVKGSCFEVVIIPHTAQNTTLGNKKVGEKINIEIDMLAKYVEKLMTPYYDKKHKSWEEKLKKYF